MAGLAVRVQTDVTPVTARVTVKAVSLPVPRKKATFGEDQFAMKGYPEAPMRQPSLEGMRRCLDVLEPQISAALAATISTCPDDPVRHLAHLLLQQPPPPPQPPASSGQPAAQTPHAPRPTKYRPTEDRPTEDRPTEDRSTPSEPRSNPPTSTGGFAQTWTAAGWVAAACIHDNIAASLLDGRRGDELGAMRELGARSDLESELRRRLAGGVDALVSLLADKLRHLASHREETASELQNKFSQDVRGMLTYGSLNIYFGGLEGILGAPDPKVNDG